MAAPGSREYIKKRNAQHFNRTLENANAGTARTKAALAQYRENVTKEEIAEATKSIEAKVTERLGIEDPKSLPWHQYTQEMNIAYIKGLKGKPEPTRNTNNHLLWLTANSGSDTLIRLIAILLSVSQEITLSKICPDNKEFIELVSQSLNYISAHPYLMTGKWASPGSVISGTLDAFIVKKTLPFSEIDLLHTHCDAVWAITSGKYIYLDNHLVVFGSKKRELTVSVRGVHDVWTTQPHIANRQAIPLSSYKAAKAAIQKYRKTVIPGKITSVDGAHLCKVLGIIVKENIGHLPLSIKANNGKGFG